MRSSQQSKSQYSRSSFNDNDSCDSEEEDYSDEENDEILEKDLKKIELIQKTLKDTNNSF